MTIKTWAEQLAELLESFSTQIESIDDTKNVDLLEHLDIQEGSLPEHIQVFTIQAEHVNEALLKELKALRSQASPEEQEQLEQILAIFEHVFTTSTPEKQPAIEIPETLQRRMTTIQEPHLWTATSQLDEGIPRKRTLH